METKEIRMAVFVAAREWFPGATKASELPCPGYWKSVAAWLEFHAGHLGDALIHQYCRDAAGECMAALEAGLEPANWKVPEEVKEIWRKAKEGVRKPAREPADVHVVPFSTGRQWGRKRR